MWMCLANPSVVTKAFQRQLLWCTVLEFPSKYGHGSSLWGTNRPTQLVHFKYFWSLHFGMILTILNPYCTLEDDVDDPELTCPFLGSHVGERCCIYCWVCWVLMILGLRIFNIRFLRFFLKPSPDVFSRSSLHSDQGQPYWRSNRKTINWCKWCLCQTDPFGFPKDTSSRNKLCKFKW